MRSVTTLVVQLKSVEEFTQVAVPRVVKVM